MKRALGTVIFLFSFIPPAIVFAAFLPGIWLGYWMIGPEHE